MCFLPAAGMVSCRGQTANKDWLYVSLGRDLEFLIDEAASLSFGKADADAAVAQVLRCIAQVTQVARLTLQGVELHPKLYFISNGQVLMLPLVPRGVAPYKTLCKAQTRHLSVVEGEDATACCTLHGSC
jgi:hypothetical protein